MTDGQTEFMEGQNPGLIPKRPTDGTTGRQNIHSLALRLDDFCRRLNGDALLYESQNNGEVLRKQLIENINHHLSRIHGLCYHIESTIVADEHQVEKVIKEGGQ